MRSAADACVALAVAAHARVVCGDVPTPFDAPLWGVVATGATVGHVFELVCHLVASFDLVGRPVPLVYACVLLEEAARRGVVVTWRNVLPLLLAAVSVSAKVVEDEVVQVTGRFATFPTLRGVTPHLLAGLEAHFLRVIDWRAVVPPQSYELYESHLRVVSESARSWFLTPELSQCLQ